MNKIEYLKQPQRLVIQIQHDSDCIARLKELSSYSHSKLSDVVGNGSSVHSGADKLQSSVVDYIEVERGVDRKREQLQSYLVKIREAIEQLDDDRFQNVLESRYLCGMSWQDIADVMGYSSPHYVMQLHRKAIDAISLPL